jgi:D-glycero-D-manno-heptose 1,7-bisphosphate phosphatase
VSRWCPPARSPSRLEDADTPRPTLFLDRDGCLIVDRHYLSDPAGVVLMPRAGEALRAARAAGYRLIGVSNQSGLGRGFFSADAFAAVMRRLDTLLRDAGAGLDAYYYCPHAPSDRCACRKPATGLLDEAAADFTWEPDRSWTIGDKLADVDLGLAAGLGAVLVRTGYGEAQEPLLAGRTERDDVIVADDLAAAVVAVLARGRR